MSTTMTRQQSIQKARSVREENVRRRKEEQRKESLQAGETFSVESAEEKAAKFGFPEMRMALSDIYDALKDVQRLLDGAVRTLKVFLALFLIFSMLVVTFALVSVAR